jgi:hypothetical protein
MSKQFFNKGLSTANGELWQEQRRFALRHLRDLGMGCSSIESHIQREALDVMESMKKNLGQPIDLNFTLNIAITNIVWAITAGTENFIYDLLRVLKVFCFKYLRSPM